MINVIDLVFTDKSIVHILWLKITILNVAILNNAYSFNAVIIFHLLKYLNYHLSSIYQFSYVHMQHYS